MSKPKQENQLILEKWRNNLKKRFNAFSEKFDQKQKFWFGFAVLCLLTTLIINNPLWNSASQLPYKEGDIARESIISPADIFATDVEETEKIKQTVEQSIKPIFIYDSNRAEQAVQGFRSAWENLQRKNESVAANNSVNRANSIQKANTSWTGAGGTELGRIFTARKFSANELDALDRVLRENAGGYIYGDQDKSYLENEITIIDRQKPTVESVFQNPETSMLAVSVARYKLSEGLKQIRSLSEKEASTFYTALSPQIQPSVTYDQIATAKARQTVAESVQPVTISLKRGQKIIDEGDIITNEGIAKIAAVQKYSQTSRLVNRFFGLLILISALYWGAWKFVEHRGKVQRVDLTEQKSFALFGFVVLAQTIVTVILLRLADFTAMQNVKAPLSDPMLWSFAVPFAFGSLLMTLLADRRMAIFTGIFCSLLAGLLAPRPLEFTIFSIIASSVAVYGIGNYRNRQTVTLAGILIGAVSSLIGIALIAYTQQPFIFNTVMLTIASSLCGGVITAAVTAVFLPICENMFGILTDVKLLELSNADLPVLGQLALRAPGTNRHSHAVGHLAEEACRIVGGNGLLTRIGALYHDIGKTAAPEHYVENQHGKNPHDRLKPQQSAKIIISHVTYGIKLGKQMNLPPRIIDFIAQHHGTRTLHYFLKKAQTENYDGQEVDENDFRYPGPKPQFKESAIMMIADSCEAAARSLEEPTPENIRYIVTKIIDAIITDDQLDECDLTLRELTQIREAMIKSLVAIYHSRIDYPGYVPPVSLPKLSVEQYIPLDDYGMRFADPKEIPISKGGEVEDEAINSSKSRQKNEEKVNLRIVS